MSLSALIAIIAVGLLAQAIIFVSLVEYIDDDEQEEQGPRSCEDIICPPPINPEVTP